MSEFTFAALERSRRVIARAWLPCATASMLGGCTSGSAPALVLFGAYFPSWLLFAILAIVIAIVARIAFGMVGWAPSLPFPLFTCLAIGVLVAGAVDLVWLGN
ncbi:hypothetical protein [Dyella sp. C11]|uniref:hypothetical protein n=1 Tax=Dyella sp. C11 TaxID=2126991 RepID=UPI0018E553A0|nr:hypothetical protein [Dyella sp. C11]